MRTVAIITSRWNSKRLPGKALADICGKPLLQHVVDRVRQSSVDDVCVATTKSSQPIMDYCHEHKIPFYAHEDEDDILSRVFRASLSRHATLIVRVWGDTPFLDPDGINRAIKAYLAEGQTYLYRHGVGVLSGRTLRRFYGEVENPTNREWFHEYAMQYFHYAVSCETFGGKQFTVDTPKDLEKAREIVRLG